MRLQVAPVAFGEVSQTELTDGDANEAEHFKLMG